MPSIPRSWNQPEHTHPRLAQAATKHHHAHWSPAQVHLNLHLELLRMSWMKATFAYSQEVWRGLWCHWQCPIYSTAWAKLMRTTQPLDDIWNTKENTAAPTLLPVLHHTAFLHATVFDCWKMHCRFQNNRQMEDQRNSMIAKADLWWYNEILEKRKVQKIGEALKKKERKAARVAKKTERGGETTGGCQEVSVNHKKQKTA